MSASVNVFEYHSSNVISVSYWWAFCSLRKYCVICIIYGTLLFPIAPETPAATALPPRGSYFDRSKAGKKASAHLSSHLVWPFAFRRPVIKATADCTVPKTRFLLLGRIACMEYQDAGFYYRCSVVAVCLSEIIMSCAKTAEPIEMLFEVWTRVGPSVY